MRNTSIGYNGTEAHQEWLPSQNWQQIAKKRQEKIAVAEAERNYKEKLLRRRVALTLFVLGTIGIVAPAAIYPRLSYADSVDAAMGYTEAQTLRITFGSRLQDAEVIVSDGDEFAVQQEPPAAPIAEAPAEQVVQPESVTPDATVAQDPMQPQIDEPMPTNQVAPDQSTAATEVAQQPQQNAYEEQSLSPPATDGTYVSEPAPAISEEQAISPIVANAESVTPSYSSPSYAKGGGNTSLNWWSVPSWSSSSAPQRDALGIWDTHYYIAHNWTSYGEVILNLENGDVLSVDGQKLRVIDSDYFTARTDYETVRARFGWDVWCLQTCYGDSYVRVVALTPIS